MFIGVDFNLATSTRGRDTKYQFWHRLFAAKRGIVVRDEDRSEGDPEEQSLADELEQKFVSQFPVLLQKRVNEEVTRTFTSHPKLPRAPTIAVRLVTFDYASLDTVLDLTGIDNAALRDFVISVLTIYSPPIFREVVDAPNVYVRADVNVISDDLDIPGDTREVSSGLAAPTRTSDALDRTWLIANTSLVVPVLLALAICYYFFVALNHELEATRAQAALAQSERAEVIKALQAQNAKLAELVAAHPANNDNFKASPKFSLLSRNLRTTPHLSPGQQQLRHNRYWLVNDPYPSSKERDRAFPALFGTRGTLHHGIMGRWQDLYMADDLRPRSE
jgi:hypothetical protein